MAPLLSRYVELRLQLVPVASFTPDAAGMPCLLEIPNSTEIIVIPSAGPGRGPLQELFTSPEALASRIRFSLLCSSFFAEPFPQDCSAWKHLAQRLATFSQHVIPRCPSTRKPPDCCYAPWPRGVTQASSPRRRDE